ncbi:MAG: hypothetical protein M1826_005678 [Phylliscum demangeonii]|nr:MAG: hypothetical protein M1826_005678 [Phylliscum demangeonii]
MRLWLVVLGCVYLATAAPALAAPELGSVHHSKLLARTELPQGGNGLKKLGAGLTTILMGIPGVQRARTFYRNVRDPVQSRAGFSESFSRRSWDSAVISFENALERELSPAQFVAWKKCRDQELLVLGNPSSHVIATNIMYACVRRVQADIPSTKPIKDPRREAKKAPERPKPDSNAFTDAAHELDRAGRRFGHAFGNLAHDAPLRRVIRPSLASEARQEMAQLEY